MTNVVAGESSRMSQDRQNQIRPVASSSPDSNVAGTSNVLICASSSTQQHVTSETGNGSNGNNISSAMVVHQVARPAGLGEILSITQGNNASNGSSSTHIINSGIRIAPHQLMIATRRLPPRATATFGYNNRAPTAHMNRREITHFASPSPAPRYRVESSDSSAAHNMSPVRPSHISHTNHSVIRDRVSIQEAYNPNIYPCVFSPISPQVDRPSPSTLEPVTLCKKHLRVGFLDLEDIKDSEAYYCNTHINSSHHQASHFYYNCTLEFNVTRRQLAEYGILARVLNPYNSKLVYGVNNPYSGWPVRIESPHNAQQAGNAMPTHRYSMACKGGEGFLTMKCGTCNKSLYEKDIYMFHEVGYCRKECRDRALVNDAIKEMLVNLKKAMARRRAKSSSSNSKKEGGKVAFFIGDEEL